MKMNNLIIKMKIDLHNGSEAKIRKNQFDSVSLKKILQEMKDYKHRESHGYIVFFRK